MRFSWLILPLLPATDVWAMSVGISTDSTAPAPVGTPIIWTATARGFPGGAVTFRYRVRQPDEASFRTVRDFSPNPALEWVPLQEGTYQVEVTARDDTTGDSTSAAANFETSSWITSGEPVVTPTRNELVFLYSAPPCGAGNRARAEFSPHGGPVQFTHWLTCTDDRSLNVYLAGLRPNTDYRVRLATRTAAGNVFSPAAAFTTGELPFPVAATSVLKDSNASRPGLILQSNVFQFNTAVDMQGNVVWYANNGIRYLTRPEPGGYFFALIEDSNLGDSEQIFRVIDLAGNAVLETNAAAINYQLARMGHHPITSFHHEARRIAGGKILVLAGTERILNNVQGPGDVDVMGDTILVLDRDLQVEWVWDAFDHLDPARKALLDEKCQTGTGGCPVQRLARVANDWLHGNSLQLMPDGNLLYSARHQDWVIKIDYSNGQGSGAVIWRLGKDGDFQFLSDDPWPWFSHQHDSNFVSSDLMTVFDNGNTRQADDDSAHSRGQVLHVDEAARTVSFVLNVDLGSFSRALGSAQALTNGNFHFDVGWTPNGSGQSLEFDRDGNLVSALETGTQQYRSFRMRDLYTPWY